MLEKIDYLVFTRALRRTFVDEIKCNVHISTRTATACKIIFILWMNLSSSLKIWYMSLRYKLLKDKIVFFLYTRSKGEARTISSTEAIKGECSPLSKQTQTKKYFCRRYYHSIHSFISIISYTEGDVTRRACSLLTLHSLSSQVLRNNE